MTALEVDALSVHAGWGPPLVADVDLSLAPGEVLGVVGESGSGKTTLGLALMGRVRLGGRIAGRVRVGGVDVLAAPDLRAIRGARIAHVPQDPSVALNPSLRVADHVRDMLAAHPGGPGGPARVAELLDLVRLPTDSAFARRFPHELSGGQQQRVAIAVALACSPLVAIMDEPTTALDVLTQAALLDGVRALTRRLGLALIYISHDLGVVARFADRIAVMYAGRLVESGPAAPLLAAPLHPYTAGLIAASPDHRRARRPAAVAGVAPGIGAWPAGCGFAPRCAWRVAACEQSVPPLARVAAGRRARCLRPGEAAPPELPAPRPPPRADGVLLEVRRLDAVHRTRGGTVVAAADVSFAIARGACLALVGGSGSGKTTIARCVAGLHVPEAGEVRLDGVPLPPALRRRTAAQRRRVQMVFQNPRESLNPAHRVLDQVARPALLLRRLSRADARAEARRLLDCVRLPARTHGCRPEELSGGELQRAAIARALAAAPELVICDEVTSALDVSVQAAVLEVLAELRAEFGLTLLFVTHDLGVVAALADQVAVLEGGVLREQGATDSLLRAPRTPYARALLNAAPSLSRDLERAA